MQLSKSCGFDKSTFSYQPREYLSNREAHLETLEKLEGHKGDERVKMCPVGRRFGWKGVKPMAMRDRELANSPAVSDSWSCPYSPLVEPLQKW
jgi:hypothetical protein